MTDKKYSVLCELICGVFSYSGAINRNDSDKLKKLEIELLHECANADKYIFDDDTTNYQLLIHSAAMYLLGFKCSAAMLADRIIKNDKGFYLGEGYYQDYDGDGLEYLLLFLILDDSVAIDKPKSKWHKPLAQFIYERHYEHFMGIEDNSDVIKRLGMELRSKIHEDGTSVMLALCEIIAAVINKLYEDKEG